ncbi:virB8 family protein [Paraburkholderia sp. EG285A]|uniref:virB8 family protein n=1 Tax=Paraburkholderia sp. EG285A TaxID=3237009 RepID=UPI0034D22706
MLKQVLNRMLGSKKPPVSGAAATARGLTPALAAGHPGEDREIGQWYLKQARDFESAKVENQKAVSRLAIRAALGFGVIAALAIIGMSALVLLKRPNPPAVLRVDNANGTVTVLPTTAHGSVTWTEKNDRADLRRYVEMRESYDWETIQDMHDAIKTMSGAREKDLYEGFIQGPASPVKILKDQARVIAHVGVITFIGDTAQVFFSKELVPLNNAIPRKTEYWIATIAYKHDNVPEQTSEQDVDPTGFRVLSYRLDRDLSRTPATQQGGDTSTSAAGGAQ